MSKYIYSVIDDWGEWKYTTRQDWLYHLKEFGKFVCTFKGEIKDLKEVKLSDVCDVYNPQGAVIASRQVRS